MTAIHARDPQARQSERPNIDRWRVTVIAIDTSRAGQQHQDPIGVAKTVDKPGFFRDVGLSTRVGSGPHPRIGEEWVVDRSLGTYTFLARIVPNLPVVTEDPVSIAVALHELGLVDYSLRQTGGSSTSISKAQI